MRITRRTSALLAAAVLLGPMTPTGSTAGTVVQAAPEATQPLRLFRSAKIRKEAIGGGAIAGHLAAYLDANYADLLKSKVLTNWSPQAGWFFVMYEATSVQNFEIASSRMLGDEGLNSLLGKVYELLEEQVELRIGSGWFPDGGRFLIPILNVGTPDGRFVWVREARTTLGKRALALRHARALAEYVNATHGEGRIEVYATELGDEFGWIFWFGNFATSDDWFRIRSALMQDDGYLDLLEGADGLFLDGSAHDRLLYQQ